ncbi:hypothetical protein [Gordonia sihwensis]|uniref:Uncharacterized protein n=1 Tax=Gordonia sihwensis NBRC 108236 TaxID=1223544 RepID=L7LL47_9ACTN|nr:hypothetical protein [Gordonia sihwensis]GAC61584.1 hypothetical protein GSI01S_19_00480 [Gordonia sihwensis NBRC 108236]
MSIENPTAYELHLADQIDAVLVEVEQFSSPALDGSESATAKLIEVLEEHRLAMSQFAGEGEWLYTQGRAARPRVPGVDDHVPLTQRFTTKNPEHLLAPIIVPAWSPGQPIVVHNGEKTKNVLLQRNLPEQTALNMSFCYWHEGQGRRGSYLTKPQLLTQTSGQYVVVWWVCPSCAERLTSAFPREQLGQLYDGHDDAQPTMAQALRILGAQDAPEASLPPYPTGGARGVCLFPVSAFVETPALPA